MQHARHFQIVHINKAACGLGRNIRTRHMLANNLMRLRVAHRRFCIELQLKTLVGDEARKRDASATGFRAHFAIDGIKFARRLAQFLRSQLDQSLACSGSCLAQLHTAFGNAVRA